MNKLTGAGIALCMFASTTAIAQSGDPCIAVLHAGLVNEYNLKQSANFSNDVKRAVCQSTESWKANKAGGGVKIPIKTLIVGGQFNQERREGLSQELCTDNAQAISSEEAKEIAIRLGDTVNKTYLECRRTVANENGLKPSHEVTPDGKIVTLRIAWSDPTPYQAKPPVISEPWATITGPLQCAAPLKTGTTLIPAGRVVTCTRQKLDEAAQIVVHTDWGDMPFTFEAIQAAAQVVAPTCGPVLVGQEPVECFERAAAESKTETDLCLKLASGAPPAASGLSAAQYQAAMRRNCQVRSTVGNDLLAAKQAAEKYQSECQRQGKGSTACQGYQESLLRLNQGLVTFYQVNLGLPAAPPMMMPGPGR